MPGAAHCIADHKAVDERTVIVRAMSSDREHVRSPADEQNFLLADMATGVEAARSLYRAAARRKDDGQPFSTQAAMAKLFAADTAMRVATDAVQVLGGY